MARILVPLPDRDFDTTEAAVPWRHLSEAGHEIVFATEEGAVAACDRRLLDGVLFGQLGAEPEAKQFYVQMIASPAFASPIRWDAIDPAAFDALMMVGGHAPGMRQYLGSTLLQEKIRAFWALDRPVGAICHGVLPLARAGVLRNRRTTCLPKYMERIAYFLTAWRLGRYYRTYPAYVEDEVRASLAAPSQFVRGPITLTARGGEHDDRAAFVVTDGQYVSARWPGDAYLFARTFAGLL